MPYPNIIKMDESIDSKSKPLRLTNIWTNNINNGKNDPRPIIPITNTINIEHYDLQSDCVIQSWNGLNQKSQFLKDENSTILSYSMMMEEFGYHSLLKQLYENKD